MSDADRSRPIPTALGGDDDAPARTARRAPAARTPCPREGGSIEPGPDLVRTVEAQRSRESRERSGTLNAANRDDARRPKEARMPSLQVGDLPDRLAARYLVEPGPLGPAKVYVDATSKQPAFVDAGVRLSSERNNPTTIRDLIAIAEHRGWSSVTVKGSADFKREAWMQARVAGLEVDGYKPRPRDLQALEQRFAPRERRPEPATAGEPMLSDSVDGKLLAKGLAPHCNRPGAPPSAFVRLEKADGEVVELWSPDLRGVLQRVDPQVGDPMTLERQGNDFTQVRLSPARTLALTSPQPSPTPRPPTPGEAKAERFRTLDAAARARDPELRAAQGHLSLLTTVVNQRIPPGPTRDMLTSELKSVGAERIAAGATFQAAMVRTVERAPEAERLESVVRHNDRGLERTRVR